ncbi:MAG: glycosyltransferase [Arenibacter sp.]
MKVNPRISVIMSVYNAQVLLEEAIKSILNQSFSDFEFLIVDDNSNDNSRNILNFFAKKDARIKIFSNTVNLGLTKNLNKLIQISKGEYIARMDADDISLFERFNDQIKYFEEHQDVDILGTFSENISSDGTVIGKRRVPITHEEIKELLPKLNPLSHPTVMFRAASLKEIGGYDERYKTSQDFHLWFKAIGSGLKINNIPRILFQYRMDDDYVSRKSFKYRLNEFNIKLEGYILIGLPWYKYHYALISLVLAFVPSFLFLQLKKLDPR